MIDMITQYLVDRVNPVFHFLFNSEASGKKSARSTIAKIE